MNAMFTVSCANYRSFKLGKTLLDSSKKGRNRLIKLYALQGCQDWEHCAAPSREENLL